MSINVSQIFVRYPDEEDAAGLLEDYRQRQAGGPSFLVAQTGTPWLAVSADDNMPAPEVARFLSRGLEAAALWFGLAGSILAYRLMRYSLGREEEKVLEPAEVFHSDRNFPLPAYRDVELELYRRLRGEGIPPEYLYLFIEEFGVVGGDQRKPDAIVVREAGTRRFPHRVPRRSVDSVRTLFDRYSEDEQRVYEQLNLHGGFDEARAHALFMTLENVCGRRSLPPGWKVRYLAGSPLDPDLGPRLARLHSAGGFSYEFVPLAE